ncbi:MAG: hypothetical protein PHE60_02575 [Sulfurospirillaceae bacterium]|nr:hypothetical protein [Sulfurospirillaceae bacterium]
MEEESDSIEDLERENVSESAFDFIVLVQNFNDEFFNDEYEVLKFNINFLESNGFAYQTKIDYMKLNRFIAAAYNTIESNDIQVIDALISKFYKDVVFLNSFYKNFLEKSKDAESVFKHFFLKFVGGMSELYNLLSEKEKQKLSEEECAAFEDYIKEEFINEFKKERDDYEQHLRSIINTKTYYFDKLLWSEAKNSPAILDFFKKSKRTDGELTEELSTKIFIKQYMQSIDLSHTKDIKWHQYLQNVLMIMD